MKSALRFAVPCTFPVFVAPFAGVAAAAPDGVLIEGGTWRASVNPVGGYRQYFEWQPKEPK